MSENVRNRLTLELDRKIDSNLNRIKTHTKKNKINKAIEYNC
jgi:hypothetical protein